MHRPIEHTAFTSSAAFTVHRAGSTTGQRLRRLRRRRVGTAGLVLLTALTLGAPAASATPATSAAPAGGQVRSVATSAPAAAAAAPAPAAAAVSQTIAAGADYATDTFNDAWDFSNSDDMLLNFSGTQRAAGLRMAGGLLAAHLTANSAYVSPIWGGYSDSALNGRDAGLPQNSVDTSKYNAMSLQIYSNAAAGTNFYLVWFRCPKVAPATSCSGRSALMYLHPGWGTYVVPLGRTGSGFPMDWAGTVNGLRIVFNAGSSDVRVDWARLFQRGSSPSTYVPGLDGRDLVWDADSYDSNNTAASPNWGVIRYEANPNGKNGMQWHAVASGYSADLSFLPPGTYRVGIRSQYGVTWRATRTLVAPLPELITPNEQGNSDYAAARVGNLWDMTSGADLAATRNIRTMSWAGGNYTGQNAGPRFNDPQLSFRLSRDGIDPRVYHHLTVTISENGSYNLSGGPGGGTMARMLWRRADHNASDQTVTSKALPVYPGIHSFTIDLANDFNKLTIPGHANWPFLSANRVLQLRLDPNEDPANGSNGMPARKFRVYDVSLRSDFTADGSFPITWRDNSGQAGGIATLRASTTPRACAGAVFATAPVNPGVNTTVWDTHNLAAGHYYPCLQITRNGATVSRPSRGAVVIVHKRPATPAPRVSTPTAVRVGGKVEAHWVTGGGAIIGYQVQELYSSRVNSMSAATRWTYVKCHNVSNKAQFRMRSYGPGGISGWSARTAVVAC